MFHHARGRQLDRMAHRQAFRGNFGAAAALHVAADLQHGIGFAHQMNHCRRVFWSPWYASHWLIRRSIRRDMIRRSMMLTVAAGVPIHETVIVMSPANQLVVLPYESTVKICDSHRVVDLPEIIEVTFVQNGVKTVLYADRKCSTCGQFFFCYPDSGPAPYSLPSQPQPQPAYSTPSYPPPAYSPTPVQTYPQQQPYPPQQQQPYPPQQQQPYPPYPQQQPYPSYPPYPQQQQQPPAYPQQQQPYPTGYPPQQQQPYPYPTTAYPPQQQPYPQYK